MACAVDFSIVKAPRRGGRLIAEEPLAQVSVRFAAPK